MQRVYYSFHYENDYWRLQQIRKNPAVQGQSIYAADEWENLKWEGDYRVKNVIDRAMQNCPCVVVLIGAETFDSRWVQYEIEKAWRGCLESTFTTSKMGTGIFRKWGAIHLKFFQSTTRAASQTTSRSMTPRASPAPRPRNISNRISRVG